MHAFLLVNTDPIQFAKEQKAKVIPFELQKIEDTRNLKQLTKFSFSEKTAIVIKDVDNATNEALNAFLKNVEEPSTNLIYVLTATNLKNVLPTIVSRCEVVKIENREKRLENSYTKQFLEQKIFQRLNTIGKIKDRKEAIKFVEDLTCFLDEQMHLANPYSLISNHLQLCLETIAALKANGNVSLQMTNLVVRMNSQE